MSHTSAVVPDAWVSTTFFKPLSFSLISTEPGISAKSLVIDSFELDQPRTLLEGR